MCIAIVIMLLSTGFTKEGTAPWGTVSCPVHRHQHRVLQGTYRQHQQNTLKPHQSQGQWSHKNTHQKGQGQ